MRTFAYGCLAPTAGLELVIEHIRLAARYRNNLIELEMYRRAAIAICITGDDRLRPGRNERIRQEIKAAFSEDTRALRKSSGLGWGTYQLVEQDVERASRTASPRFRGHDGTGRIGAAVQSASKLRDVDGTAFRLSATEGYATAELRITKDAWVVVPVKLHRSLPPGQILRAYLQVERIGTRWVYGLRIVVKEDEPKKRRMGIGSVAVNFGWRRVPEGVRVAYAVDDNGKETELVIPSRLLDALRHSERLRGIADEEAHKFLGDSRRRTRARNEGIRENEPHPPTRRAPWVNKTHWAKQDRHLYQWESDERAKAIRARRAIMLTWVQRIASTYESVIVEAFSISEIIRVDQQTEIPEAKHVRFLVAPGELRELLKRELGKERVTIVKGKMTATCNSCGKECKWDRARELRHTCEWCGAEWDQDANNAKNQQAAAAAE